MSIDNVTDQPRVTQILASAGQASFDYPFPIFEAADLVVNINGADVQVVDVSGVTDDNGGTVTIATPAAAGDLVTIYARTSIERLTDYQYRGRFDTERFNNELDKRTINLQELRDMVRRSVRLPRVGELESPQDLELPQRTAARANRIVGFDGEGKLRLYESGSLGGGGDGGGSQTLYWQFAGDGSAVIFALPGATSGQASNYLVTLNGVRQTPEVDYEIDAEQLIFNEPPSADTARVVVQTMGAGLPGPTGAAGPAGLAGAAGPAGSVGPAGSAGVAGPAGPEGAPGPQGERGNDGTSVVILGTVANVGELPGSGNEIGDGYIIGGDLHVWTAGLEWVNVGAIVGPQGPQGPAGPAGAAGAQGPAGPAGAQGPEGPQGVQGDPGIVVSETAPAFPTVGLLWLDTSQGEPAT